LAEPVGVAFGLGRLEIVQESARFFHRFFPSRQMLAAHGFGNALAIDGISQMVVAFE
jgi:hypothetical protein